MANHWEVEWLSENVEIIKVYGTMKNLMLNCKMGDGLGFVNKFHIQTKVFGFSIWLC